MWVKVVGITFLVLGIVVAAGPLIMTYVYELNSLGRTPDGAVDRVYDHIMFMRAWSWQWAVRGSVISGFGVVLLAIYTTRRRVN